MNLEVVTAMAAFFVTVGGTFDALVLPRIRTNAYDWLFKKWMAVVDLPPIKDLAQEAAKRLNIVRRRYLPAKLGSWRGVLVWTVVSWALTSISATMDFRILEPYAHPEVGAQIFALPEAPVYAANWVFDLLIFGITFRVLDVIEQESRFFAVVGVLIVNCVAATAIYVTCTTTAIAGAELYGELHAPGSGGFIRDRHRRLDDSVAKDVGNDPQWTGAKREYLEHWSLVDSFDCALDSIQRALGRKASGCAMHYDVLLTKGTKTRHLSEPLRLRPNYTVAITCATVFVPTMVFCLVTAILVLLKTILNASRFLLRGILALMVYFDPGDSKRSVKDFAPGTLLGSLFALIGALAHLIAVALK